MPIACVMSRVCSVSSQSLVDAADAGAVRGEQSDGNVVGLPGILEVRGQVGQVGAVILKQAQRLAGAGKSRSTVICRPHVAAQKGGRRSGARSGV